MVKDRSFVISAILPSSKSGPEGLKKALDLLSPFDYSTVEYYCQNISPDQAAALLGGKRSIFLAGARQKGEGLNPCSLDREERERAVKSLSECFHFAQQAGACAVMLSSGQRPDNEKDDAEALKVLAGSLERLHNAEPCLPILLEPGDRDVEYRHLLGYSPVAADFAASCRGSGLPFSLILDISHAAQLGEDPYESWRILKPYCDQVHLANCILDKSLPLYGDKHPFFEVPGGVYTHNDARDFLSFLQQEALPLTVSLEMICPPNEDETAFFSRLVQDTAWFFSH